jgi:hypothetical protein
MVAAIRRPRWPGALCMLVLSAAGWGPCGKGSRIVTAAVKPNPEVASYVAAQQIKFDELWLVPSTDVERIGSQIYRYVRETNRGVGGPLISSVSAHLDRYFAECVGLVVRGERQIFCNVIHLPSDEIDPKTTEFTGMFDGGANALRVILAPTLEVIDFEQQDPAPIRER